MFHREDEVLRAGTGIAVPGATITVYVNGTDAGGNYAAATKATIYPTNVVGTPIPGSVLTADANGSYSYYAPDGVYDEVLKYGAISEVDTGLQMYDQGSIAATTGADAATATAAAGVATAASTATAADRTAVAADRTQADLDAAATAADRIATAADRVQTGLDRVQTGADRVATGADRTAVAADRVATAADRVQTGVDAAAAHADKLSADTDAATATTQAGIATTQAGIATTKAGDAATSAAAAAAATVTTPQSLDIGYRVPNIQLFWPERCTAGFLVKATDGTLVANSSWTASDYIPVEAGGSFTIGAAITLSTPNGLAYYKADKTYLSGVVGPFTAGQTFTVPANAVFVRLGVLKTAAPTFVLIRGSTAPGVLANHTEALRSLPQTLDNAYRVSGLNLIDDAKSTASFLINSTTGATSANSSWKASDFFPVDANGSITIGAAIGGSSPFGLAFYDHTQSYLSGVAAPFTAGQVVSVPDGAFYARIGYLKTQSTALVVVAGSTAPGLPEAHTTARRKDYRLRDLGYRAADLTLLDIASVTRNVNIRSATGVVDNPYANVTTTGYVPVTPGGSITVGSAMVVGSPYGCAFFDINQVYISGVDGPFTAGQVLTVPNGAHYFRISYPTSAEAGVFLLEGSQTPGTNQDLYRQPRVSDVRPWSGKNIAGLGDSIMANHAYMAKVATSIHATLALNASVVGRKMQDALKDSAGVALTSANFTTMHAALLALGTNDYGGSTVFGSIGDSTATASFYGYTKLAVETIIGWKNDIVMILATPMWRSDTAANSVGKVLADYAQAIRDVAQLYSLPVLDNFKYSRLNSLIPIAYFDGLHPTTLGDDTFMVPNTVGFFETLRPGS